MQQIWVISLTQTLPVRHGSLSGARALLAANVTSTGLKRLHLSGKLLLAASYDEGEVWQ